MRKLDKTAILVILLGLSLLGGVILFGDQKPIQITCENKDCSQISPWGSVSFSFSRAVDTDLTAKLWKIEPETEGRWEWQDERHATWYASAALPCNQTIQMTFRAGQIGINGEKLERDQSWQTAVREPLIVVVKNIGGQGQELFTIGIKDNKQLNQLTYTDGKVFNFTPSPDGEQVIFALQNENHGMDFWIINRDGSDQRMLLDCGSDRCSTAAWSPVSQEIAYTRESAGLDPQGAKGAPRIWMLDLDSGETAPLFEDSQKIGYGPIWSPDGKWLSIWNGVEGGVQIINRQSGEITLLESANGDTGCWSADSAILYYANIVVGESAFHNVILKADIHQGTIETILGGNIEGEGLSYDNPACHPSENLVAASIQPNTKIPGKELTIFNLDTQESLPIMSDLTKFPSFYSWHPGGDYFLFQMSVVSKNEEDIEIWFWEKESGQPSLILTGARSPAWLP
jgi:hypothetical protein